MISIDVRRKKNRHPGKTLLDTYGAFRVFLVDGEKVRGSSVAAQEFGESASHFTLPLVVPEGEIWIEDDVAPAERPFVISGALRIAAARDYDAGIRYEKHVRQKAGLVDSDYQGELLSADCYVRQLGTLPNGVAVWLVDAEKVRDETKTDFIEGGHDLVYHWLPPKTIILDADLHADELPLILDHEATERRRMANGMKYLKAHDFADKEEFSARQHGAPEWAKELVTLGHCLDSAAGTNAQANAGKLPCPVCTTPVAPGEPCPQCNAAADSARSFPPSAAAVQRTVYAATGPGVQQDVSPAGQLAMAFGHIHQARIINLPTQYDQVSGPEVLEPGVRVTFAMHPQTLDKQPVAVQFDSNKFTEDEARAWLADRNIREYVWQPDTRDQTPVTQGNPRAAGEKPPQGFSDISSFYAATIPVEVEGGADGQRAGQRSIEDVTRTAGPHEYSSTQVNITGSLRARIREAAARIADEDLADDGRETEPHITVRYGLETDDLADVQKLLADRPAVRYTLGAVSIFQVDDQLSQRGGARYDVVKIDVDSDGLAELHDLLAELPHVDTHPEYVPHVTLAYVQPGLGQKYLDLADFSRELSQRADAVVFSDPAGKKTSIPLKTET